MGKKPKHLVPSSDTGYLKIVIQRALTSHLGGEMRKCRTALIFVAKIMKTEVLGLVAWQHSAIPSSNS